jgi:hypothetical protein
VQSLEGEWLEDVNGAWHWTSEQIPEIYWDPEENDGSKRTASDSGSSPQSPQTVASGAWIFTKNDEYRKLINGEQIPLSPKEKRRELSKRFQWREPQFIEGVGWSEGYSKLE